MALRRLVPLTLLMAICTGCPNTGDVSKSQPIYKFYIQNHWIPLAEPDSKMAPGAVVTYTVKNGIQWQGTIVGRCGIPDDLLKAVPSDAGKLTFNTSSDYGASAVLNIKGVTVGPQWKKVKSTTLELDKHGPSSLDMVGIRLWMSNPDNASKIPQGCKDLLNAPNTYLIQEAYAVSQGKYTLKDSTDAELSLKGLQAGPLSLSADAHAKPSDDGSLEFTELLYTAVKNVQFANGGWQSLGSSGQPSADDTILKQLPYVKK